MLASLRPAAVLLAVFTIACGAAYPALVTAIAQLAMPRQANGSLVEIAAPAASSARVAGSELIGQSWSSAKYFWGRPSATQPQPYNAMSSSGSNLGPTNPALLDAVTARITALTAADRAAGVDVRAHRDARIPIDLVTSSGSGLDPDITPAAARWQVPRVARTRGVDDAAVNALVEAHIAGRALGIFGEARVNVLALNVALDDAFARNTGVAKDKIGGE